MTTAPENVALAKLSGPAKKMSPPTETTWPPTNVTAPPDGSGETLPKQCPAVTTFPLESNCTDPEEATGWMVTCAPAVRARSRPARTTPAGSRCNVDGRRPVTGARPGDGGDARPSTRPFQPPG